MFGVVGEWQSDRDREKKIHNIIKMSNKFYKSK